MKGVRVKRFVIASVGLVGLGMIVLLMPMAFRRTTSSHPTVVVKADMAQPRPNASGEPDERWQKCAGYPSGTAGREETGDTEVADGNENRAKANIESQDERGIGSQTEAERSVDEFDSLTDKWMKPLKTGVSMSDVDGFVKSFHKIPKARRDECIHRALNLIPDENVMLLVGVLMDKTMDRPTVETIYRDILNRDEAVKKPILQEIFRDKTHPCWTDTAWILDVTGEIPKAE